MLAYNQPKPLDLGVVIFTQPIGIGVATHDVQESHELRL